MERTCSYLGLDLAANRIMETEVSNMVGKGVKNVRKKRSLFLG